jgi:hypothetical protein
VVVKGPAQMESWIGRSDFFTRKQTSKFIMVSGGQEITMDVLVSLT